MDKIHKMKRRDFFKRAALGAGALIAGVALKGNSEYKGTTTSYKPVPTMTSYKWEQPNPEYFTAREPMTWDQSPQWKSIYDAEIKPEVWEDLYKEYGTLLKLNP